MSEVITDYFVAMEKHGRPVGPFEKGRTLAYNATATAKPGPRVDLRQQELPLEDRPVPPDYWWRL